MPSDRDRIVELFARARPTYAHEDVLRLIGISSADLQRALHAGDIQPETNDRGLVVIPWEDVALLALEEWTPRMIQAALGVKASEVLPYLNLHRLIQVSLPLYLIRLLDHTARSESAAHHVPRNASDIIERVLHEYANTVDAQQVEEVIPGFTLARSYPYFTTNPGTYYWRCRYCNIAISEPGREACRRCVARHEPQAHLGEYGLPELEEPR